MEPSDMEDENGTRQDIEIITDPLLKYSLLEKIKQAGVLIAIATPDANAAYISTIVGIDDENHILHLDGLEPIENTQKPFNFKHITARTKLQGVKIKFSTQVLRIITGNKYTSLLASIPEKIEYHQRRSAHRVWVGMSTNITLMLNIEDHWVPAKRIIDLSIDGIGFIVERHIGDRLHVGHQYDGRIMSSHKVLFQSRIEVCHLEIHDAHDPLKVGARLIGLGENEKNNLFKLLLDIERDNIRRKTK